MNVAGITITPLHALYVAEVGGIDLARPMPREAFRVIWEAFNEHQVLVFRDQALDDERQLAFSRNFGALETMLPHAANDFKPGQVAVMTNVGKDGNLLPPTDKGMILRQRNENWHSDSSYKPVAALASLLHGREVPPVDGHTEFASARAAWDALPEARRAALEGLSVLHGLTTTLGRFEVDPNTGRPPERTLVTHPLVRTNPVNGRKGLYVGTHAREVIGLPEAEGRALLDELLAHVTQPRFVYRHAWRRHDLVIWDNRCTLHRGTPWDRARHRRVLHRTTVAGSTPDAALAVMPEPAAA